LGGTMMSGTVRWVSIALISVFAARLPLAFADRIDDQVAQLKERGSHLGWTFTVGRTSMLERASSGGCFMQRPGLKESARYRLPPVIKDLPTKFDWRDKGLVGAVRDQAKPVYCGSCWAHGSTAAFEGAIALKTGQVPTLSVQQLVSCLPSYGTC